MTYSFSKTVLSAFGITPKQKRCKAKLKEEETLKTRALKPSHYFWHSILHSAMIETGCQLF